MPNRKEPKLLFAIVGKQFRAVCLELNLFPNVRRPFLCKRPNILGSPANFPRKHTWPRINRGTVLYNVRVLMVYNPEIAFALTADFKYYAYVHITSSFNEFRK